MRIPWSEEENVLCFNKYISMLNMQENNIPFNLKKELSALQKEGGVTLMQERTIGSYRMKMQNISSVFLENKLKTLDRLKPLDNVGPKWHKLFTELIKHWVKE